MLYSFLRAHTCNNDFLNVLSYAVILDFSVCFVKRQFYDVVQLIDCNIQIGILRQRFLLDFSVYCCIAGRQITSHCCVLASYIAAAHILHKGPNSLLFLLGEVRAEGY